MNKYIKISIFTLVILLGLFFIIYGGYDDSPGAQGIGLLLIFVSVVVVIRGSRKQ